MAFEFIFPTIPFDQLPPCWEVTTGRLIMELNHPEAANEWFSVCFLKLEEHTQNLGRVLKIKSGPSLLFLKNINLNFSPFLIIKCTAFSSLFNVSVLIVVYFVITSTLTLIVILTLTYIIPVMQILSFP